MIQKKLARDNQLKYYKLIPAMLIIFTAGCSSRQYAVTFDTEPRGATLVCNGKNWGHTPKTLYYDESVRKQPSVNVGHCSANWVSGARESYPNNITVFPSGGSITKLQRARGNGYSQDANYALQLRQTRAAENASAAQYNNSGSSNVVSCKKLGDLSGQVYQFQTAFCPYGYY